MVLGKPKAISEIIHTEDVGIIPSQEIKEFGVDAEEIYLGNGSTGRRIKIGGTA